MFAIWVGVIEFVVASTVVSLVFESVVPVVSAGEETFAWIEETTRPDIDPIWTRIWSDISVVVKEEKPKTSKLIVVWICPLKLENSIDSL